MRAFRQRLRGMAYCVSLLVVASALWMPTTAIGQTLPGSPFQGGGGAGVSLSGTNTWTGANTFNSSITISTVGTGVIFNNGSAVTQRAQGGTNALKIEPTSANVVILGEVADFATNYAHPAHTNPTLFLEDAAADTTQHQGLAYYGSNGKTIKTLTESAATSAVRIPVAALTGVGGTVTFTAYAADATDIQTLTGVIQYAAVNKAATETCSTPTLTGTALNSVSVGTLTCTYACDTTPANAVDIQFNCVSSLTQTTLEVWYRVNALGSSEPLPQ